MLRDEHLIDNLHATQEGRDMERAAVVSFMLGGETACTHCGDSAVVELAHRIERGEHHKPEAP
jgi:hypothetical protein